MNNKKGTIIAILLFAVVLSIFVLPQTLAIFRNSKSGSTSLKLAEWSVELNQDGIDDTVNIISGVSEPSYILKVKSLSEVDVKYNIKISNLPEGVKVKLDTGEYVVPTNHIVTFSNAGTINYSDASKEKSHTIYFKSGLDSEEVTNQLVNIDVEVSQVI